MLQTTMLYCLPWKWLWEALTTTSSLMVQAFFLAGCDCDPREVNDSAYPVVWLLLSPISGSQAKQVSRPHLNKQITTHAAVTPWLCGPIFLPELRTACLNQCYDIRCRHLFLIGLFSPQLRKVRIKLALVNFFNLFRKMHYSKYLGI